jgi:hypothetical protein
MKWTKLKSNIEQKRFEKYGEFQYDENSKMRHNKIVYKSGLLSAFKTSFRISSN